jgi:hypothetical protein
MLIDPGLGSRGFTISWRFGAKRGQERETVGAIQTSVLVLDQKNSPGKRKYEGLIGAAVNFGQVEDVIFTYRIYEVKPDRIWWDAAEVCSPIFWLDFGLTNATKSARLPPIAPIHSQYRHVDQKLVRFLLVKMCWCAELRSIICRASNRTSPTCLHARRNPYVRLGLYVRLVPYVRRITC